MKIGEDIQATDIVKGAVAGIVSQIPYVGAFAQAVENVKGNVLQRRYKKWQELVEERLSSLDEKVSQSLGDNDSFATTLLKATELAAQTSTIKSVYLANAVRYAAEHDVNEDDLIMLFNAISKYTTTHINILLYLQNPAALNTDNEQPFAGGFMTFFEKRYPSFDRQREALILRELYRDGFTNIDSDGTMSYSGMISKRTTDFGDLFLSFYGVKEADNG